MTRTITLAALAFSLLTLPAWSSAHACGGYATAAPQKLPIDAAVEYAVRTHFARTRQSVDLVAVEGLGVTESSARARTDLHEVRVRFVRGGQLYAQIVRLDDAGGSWRVVGGQRPALVLQVLA